MLKHFKAHCNIPIQIGKKVLGTVAQRLVRWSYKPVKMVRFHPVLYEEEGAKEWLSIHLKCTHFVQSETNVSYVEE